MYALVIGRALPDEKTGMMGIFEFEQAAALNKYNFKSVYAFCDTRSVKSLRIFNYVNLHSSKPSVYGYHLPIGGIPKQLFDHLKTKHFQKLLNNILEKEGKPAVIHVHFPLLNLNEQIWNLLKNLQIPIVVTEHWSKVQLKKLEPHSVSLLKKIEKESDSFNCVGEKLKQSVVELTGTNKNIEVIPNMVKPIFKYSERKIRKKKYDFVTVGRLVESKRFGLLINAFSKAFAENTDVHLNIIGNGPVFSNLKKQIHSQGMGDKITLHGFLPREKTADMLKKSDAFVSASVLETFGVPFIEAMACGRPVIGVKGGPIDIYIDELTGVLFEADNVEELAKVLINMYEKGKNYNEKQIAKRAEELFSEKAVSERLIDIFNKLINERNKLK
ncbi:glycosyltransferase [Salipaludibacillus sp. CUR1]|uniref:glycosyltransferase n=1 Tax=Salipaludibacillus sp. CUR1 TaxID=2820003 RepID=UPI001E2AEC2C|nr:glycosyltransferase [Salipaludibacillus sp. CUR1]MCE7791185.1 glycosyltransferase [Salipaludibacillus sp. CUR1]